MNRGFKILPVIFLFPMIAIASRPAFSNRDNLGPETLPCTTPCGSGWCCGLYQTCQVANAGDTPYDHTPYVCIDSLLTNNDGSLMTWPALNPTILPTNIAWLSTELSLVTSAISALEPSRTSVPPATTSLEGGGHTTNSAQSTASARNTQSRVEVSRGIIWALGFVNIVVLWISV